MLQSSVASEVLLMRVSSSANAAEAVDSWRLTETRGLFSLRARAAATQHASRLNSKPHGREVEKEFP